MAITEKNRKRLTKWVRLSGTKQNTILIDLCIQYFVVFCLSLKADWIAYHLQIRVEQGFGPLQIIVCVVAIIQMYRYSRMVER